MLHYDSTVRNSSNEVVQFLYGGDGLDPMMMEGRDKPVDFARVLNHVRAAAPYAGDDSIDGETLLKSVDELMKDLKGPSQEFKQELGDFLRGYAKKMDK